MEIAAETYATDHNGSYVGLTAAALSAYEATIQTTSAGGNAWLSNVTNVTANSYTVTTTPATGNGTFSINRTGGLVTRTCTPVGLTQGGCVNGSW